MSSSRLTIGGDKAKDLVVAVDPSSSPRRLVSLNTIQRVSLQLAVERPFHELSSSQ